MSDGIEIAILVLACFVGCTVERHFAAKDCHEAGGVWIDRGGCASSECREPKEKRP